MELSAITNKYNLPLTRPERNLISQLDGASNTSEDRYDQQIKDLAVARDVLKQLPDNHTSERQRRLEKAAILKERLKMIRQMIPFLSRSAVKSLTTEMKQIASQLASLQSGTGGGNSSTIATTDTNIDVTQTTDNNPENKPGKEEQVKSEQESESSQQNLQTSTDSTLQGNGLKSEDSENHQLNESVEELKNLYRSVLAALKRKQQSRRANGQTDIHDQHLRVYVAIPDTSNSVAIKV